MRSVLQSINPLPLPPDSWLNPATRPADPVFPPPVFC